MKCGNCYEPISKDEPVLISEYYEWKDGEKKLLGRGLQHADGYGCKKDEGEIEYPQDALPMS